MTITEYRDYEALRCVNMGITYGDVADVLERAADLIEAGGWSRVHLFDGPKMCVRGGIITACRQIGQTSEDSIWLTPLRSRLVQAAEDALSIWLTAERNTEERVHVPTWNDAEVASLDELLTTLRKVAKGVREFDDE